MARPIRHWQTGTLYFLSNRTMHGRMFLTPTPQIRALVGGIIARGQRKYGVRLYGWVVLGNHLHLVAGHKTNARTLSPFMGYVCGLVARKVGKLVGWHDKF